MITPEKRRKSQNKHLLLYQFKGFFYILPVLLMVAAIIFFSAPIDIPEAFSISQAFLIENIFYFTIWQPVTLAAPIIVIIGLLFDLTNSFPMGLSSLIFLLFYYFLKAIRFSILQMPFFLNWLFASFLGFLCAALEWGVSCLFHLKLLSPDHLIFEGLACVGLYPLIFALSSRIIGLMNTEEPS